MEENGVYGRASERVKGLVKPIVGCCCGGSCPAWGVEFDVP